MRYLLRRSFRSNSGKTQRRKERIKGNTRANLGETVRPLYAKDRILNVVARKCNQEETGSETEKQNKDRKWATTLKSIPANLQADNNSFIQRKWDWRMPYGIGKTVFARGSLRRATLPWPR